MKKKILVSVVLIVALLGTMVLATEDGNTVNYDDQIMLINETNEDLQPSVDANTLQNTQVVGEDDRVPTYYTNPDDYNGEFSEDYWREAVVPDTATKSDDFQGGDEVKVSGSEIDGNAFYSGKEVVINGVNVYGDLFVFGDYIDLQDVSVSGNIYIAGNDIDIQSSSVLGNIYVAGNKVVFKTVTVQDIFDASASFSIDEGSYVMRNLNVATASLSIDNTNIDRNVNANADTLNVGSAAMITGVLNYSSKNEAQIAEGSYVTSVNYTPIAEKEGKSPVQVALYNVVVSVLKAVFVCGFIFLFAQGFIEKQKQENMFKHIAVSTAKGFIWAIVLIAVIVLLFCTGVAIGLGFSILGIYFIIFSFSLSIVAVSISTGLNKNAKGWRAYGMAILVALVLSVLKEIAVIGEFVSLIISLAGMGLVLSSLKNKKSKVNEVVE